jgi:ABC-type sugar transport system substrate-binding protein
MKVSLIAGLCALAAAGVAGAQQNPPKPIPWRSYNQGVKWEASIDDALKRAAKENKPVLLYQLVGDLKSEGC